MQLSSYIRFFYSEDNPVNLCSVPQHHIGSKYTLPIVEPAVAAVPLKARLAKKKIQTAVQGRDENVNNQQSEI